MVYPRLVASQAPPSPFGWLVRWVAFFGQSDQLFLGATPLRPFPNDNKSEEIVLWRNPLRLDRLVASALDAVGGCLLALRWLLCPEAGKDNRSGGSPTCVGYIEPQSCLCISGLFLTYLLVIALKLIPKDRVD